jgi:GrpB-like predicted nucleotidyltransferase (UPF0157 family)
MTNHVLLAPYDPDWPRRFEEERHLIAGVFAGTDAAIEHIGSTAVPGLRAKPVIDVMVAVPSLALAEQRTRALEAIGYDYVRDYEAQIPERRYFRKPRFGRRRFHVHCVVTGSDLWLAYIAFRDYLRAHRDTAMAYETLKADLATRLTRSEYTDAKKPFIERVLASAMGGRHTPADHPHGRT